MRKLNDNELEEVSGGNANETLELMRLLGIGDTAQDVIDNNKIEKLQKTLLQDFGIKANIISGAVSNNYVRTNRKCHMKCW